MSSAGVIGPYRILGTLGQGGMGVVYRVEHSDTGALGALKTLRLPDEKLLHSIRCEIAALGRLRHPGVVAIHDHGVLEGVPWYVMPLLKGKTLRRYLGAGQRPTSRNMRSTMTAVRVAQDAARATCWWTDSLAGGVGVEPGPPRGPREEEREIKEGMSVVRRLCHALAYIHGEGIVHRDLKPENVLVPEGGQPVLVDFGLVSRFVGDAGRENLEISGEMTGTVSYVAPEQARGELVDARADLYSLGCILYEIATGRPPFVGESAFEILRKHAEELPEPPSHRKEGLPPELDDLVLRLLAKEPRDRVGHATDVAFALASMGAENGHAAAGTPRPYLYRPSLVGRAGTLADLAARVARLEKGRGGLVLLAGESGVGKTRLSSQVGSLARRSRYAVMSGTCPARATGSATAPLQAWRGPLVAIADRCRQRGEDETRRLLGDRASLLAPYEPELASLPGLGPVAEPVQLGPGAARIRLFECLADVFSSIASESPLVTILEDLHWADDLSLDALSFLMRARRLDHVPWLVLASYRSDEASDALRKLARVPACVQILLERLAPTAVREMVADMLALHDVPEDIVEFLAKSSEGNPLFVAEYLRAAVGADLLHRDASGRWRVRVGADDTGLGALGSRIGLPATLRELVARRLADLTDGARRMMDAAAVVGRDAPASLVRAIAQLADAEAMESQAELFRRQILEEPLPGELRFVHDQIRSVSLAAIDPAALRGLHRRAAEEIGKLAPSARSAELGLHWEHAGDVARARGFYLSAARDCASRYAHEEAEALYTAYLRLVDGATEQSVAARVELATEVLGVSGRSVEAMEQARLALDEARCLGDRGIEARALHGVGTAHDRLGQHELAEPLYEASLQLSESLADKKAAVRTLDRLAALAWEQGRIAQARALAEREHALAIETEDRSLLADALGALGKLHQVQGLIEPARRYYEEAIAIDRELGDRRGMAVTTSNLAAIAYDEGRTDDALSLSRDALRWLSEIGDRANEAIAHSSLGVVYRRRGEKREALAAMEQSLSIHRAIGARDHEGVALAHIGDVKHDLGLVAEAEAAYREALAIHREVGARRYEGQALNCLGSVYNEQGRWHEAEQHYRQAHAILVEVNDRLFAGIVLENLGNILRDQGHDAQARESYQESLAIAREIGDAAGVADVLANMGILHHVRQRTQEARAAYEEAIAAAKAAGVAGVEAWATMNLGALSMEEGRIEEGRGQLALARELFTSRAEKRGEGTCLLTSAQAELWTGGSTDTVADLLARAEPLLREIAERAQLVAWSCVKGHLALHAGDGPRALARLQSAERDVEGLSLADDSELGRMLGRLRRALHALREGEVLFQGFRPEDLPSHLLGWLVHSGRIRRPAMPPGKA